MEYEEIVDEVLVALRETEVFLTAHEVSEMCDITPQKASGALRKMENAELLKSKKVKAGRGELKCYFLPKLDN